MIYDKLPLEEKKVLNTQLPSARLINNITFFGDSAIPDGDSIYESVEQASKLLAQNGFTIVDGGGPGIMEAATNGAISGGGRTIAVYWEPKLASHFEGKNTSNLTDESESYSNYVMRTLGLIEKGDVYVVCKGGTGTISELGMVWCIAKLYYGRHKPVILYGDFWDDLILAFQKTMYIDDVEMSVLKRATTPEQVLAIIQSYEEMYQKLDLKPRIGDESGLLINPRSSVTKKSYDKVAKEYHSATVGQNVAQDQLDEFMKLVNAPASVLDIGCGPGTDTKVLSEKYSVTGIEMVKKFADIASFDNPNANIVNANIIDHEVGKNKYKGVWSRDAIHHIPEEKLDAVFQKISDALVEGGIFYVIVREGQGEVVENERKNYSSVERFYHLFTEEELSERAARAGLKKIKVMPNQRSHKWLVGVFQKEIKTT